MYQLLIIIHILIAITVIGLVLIQHGKGADIGAGFGSGASNTVFGSQGTGKFLFKLTGGLALAFFVTSLLLSAMVAHQYKVSSQVNLPTTQVEEPSIPVPADNE